MSSSFDWQSRMATQSIIGILRSFLPIKNNQIKLVRLTHLFSRITRPVKDTGRNRKYTFNYPNHCIHNPYWEAVLLNSVPRNKPTSRITRNRSSRNYLLVLHKVHSWGANWTLQITCNRSINTPVVFWSGPPLITRTLRWTNYLK